MTTTVESSIVACGPAIQAGYEPGQQVKLHVKIHTHGWRDHWYDDWQLLLFYDVYAGEVPIIIEHPGPVLNFDWWTDYEKEWDTTFDVPLGTMPDEPWYGTFDLRCLSPNLGLLDSAPFYIPVREPNGNGNGNGAKTPWGWIALGAGAIATAAIIIAKKRR